MAHCAFTGSSRQSEAASRQGAALVPRESAANCRRYVTSAVAWRRVAGWGGVGRAGQGSEGQAYWWALGALVASRGGMGWGRGA